jgi:hypothetical protein
MPNRKWNKKRYQYEDGVPTPRIYHRKAKVKQSARYLIKCGDCDETLEIYYGPKGDNILEIGRVLASKKEWKKILLPLLKG